jgi:hypothetical protein
MTSVVTPAGTRIAKGPGSWIRALRLRRVPAQPRFAVRLRAVRLVARLGAVAFFVALRLVAFRFLAGAFLAALRFLAGAFLAAFFVAFRFFAGAFLAALRFLAGAFFAARFLVAFFATRFLAGAFLAALRFLAGAFLAALFFVAFLAGGTGTTFHGERSLTQPTGSSNFGGHSVREGVNPTSYAIKNR